ncbi:TIR domain-containing protein [Levilactobacillus zymae]|uniref:Thoeris protein ThsB TIR-like domain-containing protein n=1 Tax=Levilactobacillus zymae TaxID=267363 RepID=A0ABQ0WWY5_9LACO|nr:TIR domain-containing protein [Levilactobacillus zymae]KRL15476.1 hypothetical protein FD38_GL000473 [Levilactobacillus zymae DSM 19395]QFR60855.1 TIR domain-containing protein [Levilactobacillus zymae]GEO71077.1 hypothetical protein LZY01_02450 [Levilactobacillus zymae]
MSKIIVNYQDTDPLAHSFRVQLSDWSAASWDFPVFSFQAQQPDVAFDSRQAHPLKRQLRREIKTNQGVLVVISRETWQSEWVNWEINTVVQQDKQLLAAKLDATNITPLALFEADPLWIDPFDPRALAQDCI